MSYLNLIDKHKDVLITGSQVEMEYQKNRQRVILESLGKFKSPEWSNLNLPALLAGDDEAKQIEKHRKEISKKQTVLNNKIEKILKSPATNDPVYKTLQALFKTKSPLNLDREHEDRREIRDLAIRRFMLGYPPRKKNETSIGDSVNWEWIIRCANESKKNIIIVTRDGDYGVNLKKDSFINDWLNQEFKERVSKRQKIRLTTRLSEAFGSIDLPVSDDMIEEEARMIKSYVKVDSSEDTDEVSEKIFEILKDYET